MYSNYCGNYCAPEDYAMSKKDRNALLKEKQAILEAKLATIKHWIETSDDESEEEGK